MVQSPVGPAGTFPGFGSDDAPREGDLYKCIHCGFCLNACPTYLETGLEAESPRGRISLMKAVNEGRLDITPTVVAHWDLCIQCRACEPVCPSGVPFGSLMAATRAEIDHRFKRPLRERVARAIGFRHLLPRSGRLRTVARAIRLYRRTGLQRAVSATRLLRLLPGRLDQLESTLPQLSGDFFIASGQVIRARGVRKARVALLAGCVMPIVHGETMRAAARVLARNGVEVVVPRDQGCCGALNAHAGERTTTRDMARRNIDAFLEVEPDAVVVASAGCGAAMKEYTDLLHGDPVYRERAGRVAALTRDIHEFLAGLPIEPPTAPLPLTVTYQDACHLANAQRITAAPRALLRAIPGLKLIEMAESALCCGSGGTYSLSERVMSGRLGRRKAANITAAKAQVVATGNPGCALQMRTYLGDAGSETRVRYVVDLLDQAYAMEDSNPNR